MQKRLSPADQIKCQNLSDLGQIRSDQIRSNRSDQIRSIRSDQMASINYLMAVFRASADQIEFRKSRSQIRLIRSDQINSDQIR